MEPLNKGHVSFPLSEVENVLELHSCIGRSNVGPRLVSFVERSNNLCHISEGHYIIEDSTKICMTSDFYITHNFSLEGQNSII